MILKIYTIIIFRRIKKKGIMWCGGLILCCIYSQLYFLSLFVGMKFILLVNWYEEGLNLRTIWCSITNTNI